MEIMEHDEFDDTGGSGIGKLPNFIPPQAQAVKGPNDQQELPIQSPPASDATATFVPSPVVAVAEPVAGVWQRPDGPVVAEAAPVASSPAEPVTAVADAAPMAEVPLLDAAGSEEVVAVVAEADGTAEPVVATADAEASEAVSEALETAKKLDQGTVALDQRSLDALLRVANNLNASNQTLNPADLRQVNAALSSGQVTGLAAAPGLSGAQTLNEGTVSLVGAAFAVAGGAVRGIGRGLSELTGAAAGAVSDVAGAVTGGFREKAGVTVLPRLSEYRVDQVEKSTGAYQAAMEKFWAAGGMTDVRREIEERARRTGLSVQDVVEKMKPNGEMADLHNKFTAAVEASPDAQTSKKAMDKALDGWVRQYGRAQDELLNPETHGNPHYDTLKSRLEKSQGKMQENTLRIPAFAEETSHAAKLKDAIEKMAERLREMVKSVVNTLRGTKETESAPSP